MSFVFRLFFSLVILIVFLGCNSHPNEQFYKRNQQKALLCCDTARQLIQTGDIITRTGMDFTSSSLRKLNTTDKTYSHVGIASIENGVIYIYHAIGGESNPNEKIRRDRLSYFVNGRDNSGFGIFRFNFDRASVFKIQRQAQNFYGQGISFDMSFDLKTDDKMYCTEFVAKTIEKALQRPHYFPLDTLSRKVYIAPDGIFLHRDCGEIKRLRYF
ncbi:MAG: hypothetical protein DI598_12460 [Pseudopedobacter saltans]|uniref:Uncharacterized protein n=1 Tax=Pseudopedobacter saltans TaxID=151895 RepID=A0A2W5EQ16_9SPHI|nr:MAG: hypothetical protein DI598_12460 [Pseudopedobacter saltans]